MVPYVAWPFDPLSILITFLIPHTSNRIPVSLYSALLPPLLTFSISSTFSCLPSHVINGPSGVGVSLPLLQPFLMKYVYSSSLSLCSFTLPFVLSNTHNLRAHFYILLLLVEFPVACLILFKMFRQKAECSGRRVPWTRGRDPSSSSDMAYASLTLGSGLEASGPHFDSS